MALETATYISDLNTSNPTSTDPVSQGDDHLRLIKSALKTTFPNVTGAVTATHTELNYVDALTSAAVGLTDTQTLTNKTLTSPAVNTPTITGTKEIKVAMSANAIDLATGNYFTKTISTNTTFTVSNTPSAGTAVSFILELTNAGAYTLTWWSNLKWEGGSAPTLTSSGRDVLGFYTHDGGSTWNGILIGKNMA
jgi:hypothetical protein